MSFDDGPSWWHQTEFPLDVYPPDVKNLLSGTADSMCVHPDLLASALLPIVGTLIGNSRWIQTHDGPWREPPRLWVGIIADPGGKKSPAIDRLMAPLAKVEDELDQRWAYLVDQWKDNPDKNKVEAPKPIRLVGGDITIAALGDRVRAHPRGYLVHRDELSGWLKQILNQRGGVGDDREQWLELWPASATIRNDRKTGNVSTVQRKAFVGLLGGIQPERLNLITGTGGDDGMLDRFLLCAPPEQRQEWGRPSVEQHVIDVYCELLDQLYRLPMGQVGSKVHPTIVECDAGGMALAQVGFKDHWAQLETFKAQRNPLRGMWAKVDAHVYRLALVLTELWHVCEGAPEVVDEYRMRDAWYVIDYFKNQRRKLQDLLAPGEYERAGPAHESKVLAWLKANDGKSTITQLCRGPLQRMPAKEARAVVDTLAEKEIVVLTRLERATVVVLNRQG